MTIEEFWKVLKKIDQDELENMYDTEAVQPIINVLSKKTESEIKNFDEHLAQLLFAIDGREWSDESGESSSSDDGFLYARCYVIAKGEEYFSKVLTNPVLMPKSSDQWAESLLYVAQEAWQRTSKKEYLFTASVSYETCSNEAQW